MKDGAMHICVCVREEGVWVAETGTWEDFHGSSRVNGHLGTETRENEGRTCEGWSDAHMCVCRGGGHVVGRDWICVPFVTCNSGHNQLSFLRLGCKKTGFYLGFLSYYFGFDHYTVACSKAVLEKSHVS